MKYCRRKGIECECLSENSVCNSDNCYRKLPDKKLTDSEIVKVLNKLYSTSISTTEFQVINVEGLRKFGVIFKATLDLINRLQAENERLKKANEE